MNCESPAVVEKRKKVALTKDEQEILRSLFFKALGPMVTVISISCVILFLGFQFLMKKTSFSNYGISPESVMSSVGKFIDTYILIAATNVVLTMLLCIIVLYLALQNIVFPIMRITRSLKKRMETGVGGKIHIRKTDKLFIPLVDLLNKLIGEDNQPGHN